MEIMMFNFYLNEQEEFNLEVHRLESVGVRKRNKGMRQRRTSNTEIRKRLEGVQQLL
jgi:hypothetical protein